MTIPVAKAGEQSLLMKIGYPAVVSMLEQKLSRVTRLIPKTFTTARWCLAWSRDNSIPAAISSLW
jgi:hypothetical protein